MKSPISSRLLNQQLAAPQFGDPTEVVSHLGAVQAQDYRLSRWAVASRTRRPSAAAFRAAFDSGRIIRLHMHRCTWQLIAAEDHGWMQKLLGPKALQVMKGWMSANKISIPDDEKESIREILLEATSRKGSVTKQDYVEALAERDIVMDDHRLSYHIRLGELDGFLCSGLLDPKDATYSLVSEKVKHPLELDRDESLALLARKYFQSHAPATLEDFVWWSGLGINDCRRAVQLLGAEIHVEKFAGREFLVLESCRTRGCRSGQTLLVAPYDEYLIGYKSRDLVLAPEHAPRAHNNSGIFYPIVVHDGRVCGNWTPFAKTPGFRPFSEAPTLAEPVEAAFRTFRTFISEI